jgi:hypothetical protein
MPFTLDQVHDLATSLPDVEVGPKWGMRTWMVGGKGFAWERPLRKADLERLGDQPAPTGDILGVRTESLDAKDMLLAMELPGFFTIQHFNGFPAVLIALRKARAKDVRAAVESAYQAMAAKRPKRRAPTPKTKKTKKPPRRRSR